jgi:hypothetical protein
MRPTQAERKGRGVKAEGQGAASSTAEFLQLQSVFVVTVCVRAFPVKRAQLNCFSGHAHTR